MRNATHILILEDNPADVDLIKAELRDANIEFTATVVSREREFIDKLRASPPDLILSDYAMPQFDGISAMKIVLSTAPSVPFIIVTGSMDEETAVDCMKAGAADYVLKQRLSRLGPAVKNALQRKRALEQQQQAEQALRDSESRYRMLFDSNPLPMWVFDLETLRFLAVNDAAVEHYGYSREEFLSMTIKEIRPADEVPVLLDDIVKVRRSIEGRGVWRHRRKDGSDILVEVTAHGLTFQGREARLVLANDVTERKKAELEVAKSEQQLRSLFAAMKDVVLVLDKKGKYIQIAPTNPDLVYKPPSMLLGKTIHEVLPKEDAERIQEHIDRALKTKNPVHVEYALVVNNSTVWFDGTVSPFTDDTVVWIARDITERKKAELLQSAVYRIASAANEVSNLDELYRAVHQIVKEVMPAENFYIALYDKKTDLLSFPYFIDEFDKESEPSPPQHPGKGLTAYVLRTGESLLCTEQYHAKLVERGEAEMIGTPSRIWLGVPLKIENKTVGVMAVQHYTHNRAYGEAEKQILEYVSSQVAKVIERKKAEEALSLAHSQTKNLFDSLDEAIFSVDVVNNKMLQVSPAHEKVYGHPPEEFFKDPMLWYKLMLDDDKPIIDRGYPMLMAGRPLEHEFRIRKPNGEIRWLEARMKPTLDSNGKLVRFDGVVFEITQRKKAEEQLSFQATLLDQVNQAVMATDNETRIVYWNHFAEEMFGWAAREAIGKSAFDLIIPPEGADEARRILQHIHEKGSALGEFIVQAKSGRRFPVEFSAAVVKDVSGNIIGFVSGSTDITERKKAEAELLQQTAYFRQLFEKSPLAIVLRDTCDCVLDVNAAFTEIFQYTLEDVKGRSLRDFIVPNEKMQEVRELAERRERGEIILQETVRKRKDGTPVDVALTAYPVVVEGRQVGVYSIYADITKRKHAEEALRENEAKLKSIVESSTNLFYAHDVDHHLYFLSPQVKDILGYEVHEAMTRWTEFASDHPVNEIGFQKTLDAIVTGKPQPPYELELVHKSGRKVWVEVREAPVVKDGKTVAIVGSLTDITERKFTETELLRQTSNFRQLFDSSPEAIALLDDTDNVIDVNRAFTDIFQYTMEEVRGHSLSKFILPDDRKDEALAITQKYKQGEIVLQEVVRKKKNGEHVDVALTSYPIIINDNRVGSYRIYQDIGERKKAEKELLRQTSYFRQLFESSPSAIVLVDTNDHVLDINRSFTELFQYTLEEIKGRSLNDCIIHEEKRSEAIELSAMTLHGKVVVKETVRKRKNDETFEVIMTGYPITIDNKLVGVYAMYTDISGRKRLEDQLRQSQKLESIGTLAGGIAHDFNNILGIILGHTTLLERLPTDHEKVKASTDAITRATQRGAALVRQLLTFARKADVSIGSVRVNDMVKEIKKLLYETFPKIIEVRVQLDDKLPLIAGDATQMHQVLLNLCVNARDAMMPKGGVLTIKTEQLTGDAVRKRLPAAEAQAYIALSVSDTGSGMDEATRARIFEPFFTTKELGKGTGLGLSTVYGIVQNHGGLIDVETAVGHGTTFHMYFPIQIADIKPEDQAAEKAEETIGGSETILLVEDEDMLRELATMVLKSKGYAVLTARDGMEGVKVFQEHSEKISLVLSDMGLPKLGGFDMFKEMKKLKPEIRVILASGYIEPGLRSDVFNAGVKDFVQKPFIPAVLLKKIRHVLDDGEREQS